MEDTVNEQMDSFAPTVQPGFKEDAKDEEPAAPAKSASSAPTSARKLSRLGGADSLSAAANRLKLSKPDSPLGGGAAPAKGGKKRWLAGRGNAKRKKLEENTRLKNWLDEQGVWVNEANDWGRQGSPAAMAIETREQGENEISGRGLVARRDINLYEELCRVPTNIILSKEQAIKKFGAEYIPEKLTDYQAIALHLIYEAYYEKENSFWEPYIQILPTTEEVGACFTWDADEIDMLLNGTSVQVQAKFLKENLGKEFLRIKEDLIEKFPDTFHPEIYTEERWVWAYSVLFSRAVRIDFDNIEGETEYNITALVPYVDLINHNPQSSTYIMGHREGIDLPFGLKQQTQEVIVTADKYYAEYEQIYISYGPKSNAQLLMYYGFSMERNNNDFVEVYLGHLMDDDPLGDIKRRVLRKRGIEKDWFPLFRERYTSDMIAYVRLLVLEEDEIIRSPSETLEEAMTNLDITSAFGEVSERRAMTCIKTICEDMLATFPTTLEEDQALIQDRSMFELLPKNQRMALRVRYGQKLILMATITTVNRVLNNLGKLNDVQRQKVKRYRKSVQTAWGRLGVDFDNPAIKATNFEELLKELDI